MIDNWKLVMATYFCQLRKSSSFEIFYQILSPEINKCPRQGREDESDFMLNVAVTSSEGNHYLKRRTRRNHSTEN